MIGELKAGFVVEFDVHEKKSFLNSKGGRKRLKAEIVEVSPSDRNIIITLPTHEGKPFELSNKREGEIDKVYLEPIELKVFAERSDYKYSAVISSFVRFGSKDGDRLIRISLLDEGKAVQRREFLRLSMAIPFSYIEMPASGNAAPDHFLLNGLMLDISGGGMMFKSEEEMERETKLHCIIPLRDKEIKVIARITNKTAPKGEGDMYVYATKFEQMRPKDQDFIVAFVLDEQVKRKVGMQ